jgi:hypothetical protein
MADKPLEPAAPGFQIIPSDPKDWPEQSTIYCPIVDGPDDPLNEVIRAHHLDEDDDEEQE